MATTTTTTTTTTESVSASVPAFQTLRTRAWILACFYITVALSLPYWHKTTTIERRALPYESIQTWEAALPCPVRFRHTLTLRLPPDTVAREDAQTVTQEIARGLEAAGDGVWVSEAERKAIEEGMQANSGESDAVGVNASAWPARPTPLEHAACIDWTVRLSDTGPLQQANSLHYIITFPEQGQATDSFLSTSTTRHFSIDAATASLSSRRPSELAWSLTSQLSRVLQLPYRDLYFQSALPTIGREQQQQHGERESQSSHDATQSVLRRIDNTEMDKRQIPYTRNVRLVFSLINEDASVTEQSAAVGMQETSLRGLTGVAGWDAKEAGRAFARRIRPVIEALQGTHEIATEMQTIWFAPLPFQTKALSVNRVREAIALDADDEDDKDEAETASGEAQSSTALVEQHDTVHLVQRADLQIFVNAGEWGLSSGGASTAQGNISVSGDVQSELTSMVEQNERTLHFIVYVPKPSHRPLRIASDAHATNFSAATAWLVPQWGGVALYNLGYDEETKNSIAHRLRLRRRNRRRRSSTPAPPAERARQGAMLASLTADELDTAFAAFAKQLRTLLGLREVTAPVPSGGGHLLPSADARLAISLDALLRRRIVGSVRESVRTLGSIVRLVDKIKILGVGREVQHDVRQALAMLERGRALNDGHDAAPFRQGAAVRTTPPAPLSPLRALLDLAYAGELLSARAFFNPAMLGQLYFPDEHKYAVYTPLFGPLAMPLLVAALRLVKERRKARKAAAEAAAAAAAAAAAVASDGLISAKTETKKKTTKAHKSSKLDEVAT